MALTPKVIECHYCGEPAKWYYSRKFVNELKMDCIKQFYKCTYCYDKMCRLDIPVIDNSEAIDVFEYMKTFNKPL